jgi:cell wall-associated NlpC family hydrolase
VHERSSSRGRRKVGTGVIALSLGLGLLAGTMSAPQVASAAAVGVAPKLAQTANLRTISYGTTVKLTTTVRNTKTGKVVPKGAVRFQAYRNGWKTWATRTLSKSGTVTFASRPLITTSYRTVFLGGAGLRAGVSNAIRVTVRANGAKVVSEAARHKGALYKYGAAGPKRFDCSGFTMYVFKKTTGRKLPHKANSQQRYGKAVSKGSKKPGDLIIFRSGGYGYHAAVYAGGGKMWDSPHSGARVSKRKMISSNYVVRRLV